VLSSNAKVLHSDPMVNKLVKFGSTGSSIASKDGQLLLKELKLYLRGNPAYAGYIQNELRKLYTQNVNSLCDQYESSLPKINTLH
jgi:hypothetical protein